MNEFNYKSPSQNDVDNNKLGTELAQIATLVKSGFATEQVAFEGEKINTVAADGSMNIFLVVECDTNGLGLTISDYFSMTFDAFIDDLNVTGFGLRLFLTNTETANTLVPGYSDSNNRNDVSVHLNEVTTYNQTTNKVFDPTYRYAKIIICGKVAVRRGASFYIKNIVPKCGSKELPIIRKQLYSTSGGTITNVSSVNKLTKIRLSKWAGKKWNCLGDSITERNVRTVKNYHDYIANWVGCSVNNYGISGTGWFTPSTNGGTNYFYNRVASMDASADLITVFGGTNDWDEVGKTLVMGTMGDTNPETSLYGAVNDTITQLITKYPNKTIAVFTPLPRNNNWGNKTGGGTLEQITQAIKDVCNKYSIPVLDLYHQSGIQAFNSDYRLEKLPDGLHLNDLGHYDLAEKILAFINSL